MTELLTVDQVAVKLHCSTRKVRRIIAAGELRPVYVGRTPLVTEREFEAYINAGYRRRGAA